MTLRAAIAGATGLIGSNLAEHLVSKGWEVYGVARKPETGIRGVRPVAANLLDPEALRASLAGIDPTHVFFTTWVRKASEEENIAANGALVRNLLAALDRSKSVRHAALVTGLKHYLGPFEYYAKVKPDTPLREAMPRLPFPNFFYAQEDELFAAAPWENGYAESFNSKVRDELLNAEEFASELEARVLGKEWRREYNQVRPHSSLGYRTPAEYGEMCPRADSASLRRPEDTSVAADPTLTAPGT